MQRIGRWGGFLVVAAMFAATGCGSLLPTGPRQAAEKFASAFAHRDVVAAARLTDQPEAAQAALTKAWTGLAATGLETDIGQVRTSGDTGTVDYAYRWRLAPGDWSYHGTLQMDDSAGDWKVRWSSTAVHPDLGADQELRVDATPAPMARVNTRSGPDVLVPGLVHAVLFDPDAAGPYAASSAAQLAAELSRFDRGLTAQSIVESATAAGGAYQVITLRGSDFQPLAASLSVLPGVRFQDRADLLPTDPGFAPDVIGRVRQDVVGSIRGTAGWSVVTVNPNGRTADVLTEHAPQPVPSFTLTLDRAVQNAAQRAVDHPAEPAVMVVLRPSTGELLAVAQNRAADAQGPLATTGRFPPGSTFKIVTAAAALAAGMAGPRTMVPCPGRVDVFTRTVPNYRGFALGTVPLTSAFAHSCNTTFAKLAGDMRPDALRRASAQLGLLARYGIEGLPTRPASVPAASDPVVRVEDGFGQGRVLATPLAMAIAAATVARGSAPPAPRLIVSRASTVSGERPAIDPAVVAGLRTMMRATVTEGTGQLVAGQGEVYGKTGEAEYAGGSHAWFVGYRGDLAFATLIVGGGGSERAVLATRDVLSAIPTQP